MESIRNAANAAAVALGYDQTDKEVAGDQLGDLVHDRQGGATTYGGEAPQNTYSGVGNSQSGIEPVSGRLGSGTAGQPYDAGNDVAGSNVAGYGSNTSGINPGSTTSGYGSNASGINPGTTTSGYGSNTSGINPGTTSSGYGSNTSGINSATTSSGYGSNTSGINSGTTTSGINSRNAPAGYGSTTSGTNSGSVPAGYESTSGYGNNTGYDNSTSRGLGADATQQGNHYTSTVVAGKLDSALGLDATRRVEGGSTGASTSQTTGYGQDASYGREGRSHGLGGSHDSSLHGLGSDRAAGSDRYLFHPGNAPGLGGRNAITDDFTDSNIHHEGSGDITGKLGSDASSGRAGAVTGVPGAAIAGIAGGHKGKDTERSRKPGYGRSASGLGSNTWGLNSGASQPKESTTHKIERKAEEYTGVGAAGGAAGYATTQSGREPLSGARGSGVAGEPYDQGNTYDGAAPQDTGITGAYGAGYGQDRGLSEATSGVNDLNVNDRQTGATGLAGAAYDGTSSNPNYGATAPRHGSGSTFGAGGLSERIAGAPNPDSTVDECEEGHHNAHPTGAAAHVDGTHKPTFLNYRNDEFGVPVAKGP